MAAHARYAGFWYRALALIVDGLLSQALGVALVLPVAFSLGALLAHDLTSDEIASLGENVGVALGTFITWLYFTASESSGWQATPGKRLLGLRVTDERGGRISFGRANGRYWSKLLSALTLGFGYLMAGVTEKKQALHDKIACTLVVKVQE